MIISSGLDEERRRRPARERTDRSLPVYAFRSDTDRWSAP